MNFVGIGLILFHSFSSAIEVRIRENEGQWTLYRDGTPYFIKGAGGSFDNRHIDGYGANSVRTWSSTETTSALTAVQGTVITICAGFSFDLLDILANPYQMKTTIIDYVYAHKDNSAILIWCIGNEVHHNRSASEFQTIFAFIDEVGSAIKAIDTAHPTMTVIADELDAVGYYLNHLDNIDIIGINSFGSSGSTIGSRYTNLNVGKPFILTEFGPSGWWEVESSSFGAPFEPSSTSRMTMYRTIYENTVNNYKHLNCLGSYVFLWGWKNETTPTWFGMFYSDGSRLGPIETMVELWDNGSLPIDWNHIPEIGELRISKTDNISIGERLTVECSAADIDGDNLIWTFELIDQLTTIEGGYQNYPNSIENITGNKCIILPPFQGQFRIYGIVRDGHGNAAFASIPIRVNQAQMSTPPAQSQPPNIDQPAIPSASDTPNETNTGAIVGGVIAGIVEIGAIVGVIIYRLWKKNRTVHGY
jgi:hypothetical protein